MHGIKLIVFSYDEFKTPSHALVKGVRSRKLNGSESHKVYAAKSCCLRRYDSKNAPGSRKVF